jgi:cyclophilin family peptidyl-prolyl cis-trans isomerase
MATIEQFVFGNGSGGESIFNGKKFKDERPGLLLKHDRRGILSMGNSGKNSNTSQFFITFEKAPQCDGKHVIFGEVVSGWDVLDALGSTGKPNTEIPQVSIKVTDCGPWTPLQTPGAGYWYDQPDEESYSGISPVFMVRPRVAVLAPSDEVADKFKVALEPICNVVTVTAIEAIDGWLQSYAIDLLVVAPACETEARQITVPSDWGITSEQVILISKPMNALQNIRSNSWLISRNWPLDGAI